MLRSRILMIDDEDWGIVLTFKAGDHFPVHVHPDEEHNHISIVMTGAIQLEGHPDYEGEIARATPEGTIINWEPGKPHGWTCLEDATVANLKKRRGATSNDPIS